MAKQPDNKGLNTFILIAPGEKNESVNIDFAQRQSGKQATPPPLKQFLNLLFGWGQKIGQPLSSPGSITCDHNYVMRKIKQHFLVRAQSPNPKTSGCAEESEKGFL